MSSIERVEKSYKLAEVIQEAIQADRMLFYCCMPGRILKYNASEQKATVEIMLKKKYTLNDENGTDRPPIKDVPVHYFSGNDGNKYIHVPVKENDLGMLLFCDRSLDVYLSGDGSKTVLPGDVRNHDISDAFFIPGVQPFAKALQGVNADDVILKNESTVITIKDGTLSVDNGTNELIAVLEELANWLKNDAQVLTQAGPQPFTVAALGTLTPIINKLTSFKV